MKKVKVKLIGDGKTPETGYTVNLPTFRMVSVDYVKKECVVEVLDDEVLSNGKIKLNQKRIREKYKKNWSNFNASEVETD